MVYLHFEFVENQISNYKFKDFDSNNFNLISLEKFGKLESG